MGGAMFHVSRYVSCFCVYLPVVYAISISMLCFPKCLDKSNICDFWSEVIFEK